MSRSHKPVRTTAAIEGDFVVFLIGMRINRPLAVRKWWPMIGGMRKMIMELAGRPESGFLHAEPAFGRTIVVVQYWRSMEALLAYANDPSLLHRPEWQAFYRGTDGSVGVWHEAYAVRAGEYESVYIDMPKFGLAAFGTVEPAVGRSSSAADRLQTNQAVP